MNLLLLEQQDLIDTDRAKISGRRLQHMLAVHRVSTGDQIKAGLLNGAIGNAVVESLTSEAAELSLDLCQQPPSPLPLNLVLALPRPKMLNRVLQTAASMGVKRIHLINSYRVEKSYWQSPLLNDDAVRKQLILGLEQSRDTALPEVHMFKLFKPFAEDRLPGIIEGTTALVAHPGADMPCPVDIARPATLAVGPEGGFIPWEVEKLQACGFSAVSLGARILRVETAIPALLARLFP